ncbi:MAG: M61 family metallopeptidase [Roseivirga sp.]|uniref:M61 family metallopeptidase n=1 Tax=Roseivirga sp. TaxID=1964215 RepID=UPI001B0ACAFB|nr:PDZ domain-containing protein [Roseivirga sp.]MBO6660884.1 M61 family metallopeptidase [Roseivirga sp.]MBO6909132.1 M61 family metallopeptidase [Roseivirga sp.]
MKKLLLTTLLIFCFGNFLLSQTYNEYEVSFDNRVHHEANIKVTFSNLENKVLEVRMSRSSPGRYAVHEFAKNVYSVKATDGKGNELPLTRPNPHQWDIAGHDGTVVFEYTLFANRAGGTYSGIDETHAHLNIPATYVWARNYDHRPVKVKYNLPAGSNWKVATQMKDLGNDTFYAPNTYYFMDSPTEIADFHLRERMVDGQNIRLALHTSATDAEVDAYFEELIGIVEQQAAVFGELPDFDFGEYTFLSCYVPNASGDGMEHRNSTYVVSGKPNDRPLGSTSMGTISHEFFHAWNVERIRPASLEPFSFEDANMSGELWFAEGFTSYYTNLIRARSGSITAEQYVNGLGGSVSYVINAPGRKYFNPIEMSYRAPFVDAASSIDPDNNSNIFISYYTYGSVLGLALDMSLRTMDNGKNLDDFMKHVWKTQGKPEIPYSVRDLQARLAEYAGDSFANEFFGQHIFKSEMPDYEGLFKKMGVVFENPNAGAPTLNARIIVRSTTGSMVQNALVGTPLYEAGIEKEDKILSINGTSLATYQGRNVDELIADKKPGDVIEVEIDRWGEKMTKKVTLAASQNMRSSWDANANAAAQKRREEWLKAK